MLDESGADTLAFTLLPLLYWKKSSSINPQEGLLKEITGRIDAMHTHLPNRSA